MGPINRYTRNRYTINRYTRNRYTRNRYTRNRYTENHYDFFNRYAIFVMFVNLQIVTIFSVTFFDYRFDI